MAPRHARQRLELVGAEHLAARIRRRADYDGARSRSDRRFQRVLAQRELRRPERGELGSESGHHGGVQVVAVVRLEEEDPVAGIEQRVDGGRICAAGPDSDADLFGRIGLEAVVARELARDAVAQLARAFGERVGAAVLPDGGDRAVADQRWGGQVADALAEVDPADALALARHAADLRLRQALQPIRDAHQGMDSNRAHLMTDTV